ncbi:MAG: DUF1570 domain-containing protein [Planctomycetales bacterium]|nr:DUF1570 domain-containing protein [Planctomycetales bacterium]
MLRPIPPCIQGFALLCLLGSSSVQTSLAQTPKLLEVEVPGGHYVGLPVHWGTYDAVVLEPNGQMQFIEQRDVKSHSILPYGFSPQTVADARVELQSEMGANYETVVFGPYVIAAPLGQAEHWRARFRRLLAGYLRYFEVRQWPLRRPDFPLRVVVYATRAEFMAYSSRHEKQIPSSMVGCYSPKTNRCALYNIDLPNSHATSTEGARATNWSETEATIVHEAVHQLAYNSGIHERLSMDPLWFIEGLACMFEQPGVYDSQQQSGTLVSRMDPARRQRLQPIIDQPNLLLTYLHSLSESDELFEREIEVAYDLSWALTFYVAERMPVEFRKYSSILAARPFGDYPSIERGRDFRQVFGGDLSLLAGRLTTMLRERP